MKQYSVHDMLEQDFVSDCEITVEGCLTRMKNAIKDLRKYARDTARAAEKAFRKGNRLYETRGTNPYPFKDMPRWMNWLDHLRGVDASVRNATDDLEVEPIRFRRRKNGKGR